MQSLCFAGTIIDPMSVTEPPGSDPATQVGRLLSRWAQLVPGHPGVGADLLSRYGDPARHYHGIDHLENVLDAVDMLSEEAARPRLVLLAAWYHDAVYDVRRDDNEERSARLAEHTLAVPGEEPLDIAEVARLVRMTERHDPADGDADGAVLSDADLSVLAGDSAAYAAYVSAVRVEYGHVSDEDFGAGRAAILEQLLSSAAVYRTALGRTRWEAAARHNLSHELKRLRS
jgi:predicted metal-dependent HD superfamily phosphohydrolase